MYRQTDNGSIRRPITATHIDLHEGGRLIPLGSPIILLKNGRDVDIRKRSRPSMGRSPSASTPTLLYVSQLTHPVVPAKIVLGRIVGGMDGVTALHHDVRHMIHTRLIVQPEFGGDDTFENQVLGPKIANVVVHARI